MTRRMAMTMLVLATVATVSTVAIVSRHADEDSEDIPS